MSSGDESETEMKRPPSPSTPPSDGVDSAMSTASIEDDDHQAVIDDEDEDEDLEKYQPFTVDDFPRVSSEFDEQSDVVFQNPDIQLRGPSAMFLFRAFNNPLVEKHKHFFGSQYQLYDESEVNVNNNVRAINCSHGCHCLPSGVLQFIDLKIVGYRHVQPGCANIFGFFAVRENGEPLRNYVYRRGIDNYEAVNVKRDTGIAHLSLTSPARCIHMGSRVLFEFKLSVRTDDQPEDGPKDDLLIEGCTEFTEFMNMHKTRPFIETRRLYGEKCGLDMKFLVLWNAVQAKVDVEILHAPVNGLNLNLYAKTSGFRDVIRLFFAVTESGCRMSLVVGVMRYSYLILCIEGSPKDGGFSQELPCCMWEGRFGSGYHGTVHEVVYLHDSTKISVKVTWKAVKSLHDLKH
ncbi:hypothetical protein CFC21_070337 [Triticum aestivum]|uniref:DUF6598 domain-containing protein n=2 Tax=Triticum aestivum TaxID=4565 RepID=A0A9R1KRM4_WHEAT|nr:uncharacterized protein LOC123114688 [Triticum aestivum]KAF7063864.1 hypothetical protein CFC21_070337 [Triticum aestivum]